MKTLTVEYGCGHVVERSTYMTEAIAIERFLKWAKDEAVCAACWSMSLNSPSVAAALEAIKKGRLTAGEDPSQGRQR